MAAFHVFDELLGAEGADALLDLARRYGRYGTYDTERSASSFASRVPERFDAAANYVRSGGIFGQTHGDVAELTARTNYFREEYYYRAGSGRDEVLVAGIEAFRDHPGLADAARAVHDREVVVPAIVYANLLVRGQELAVHTDVPEFRGANRRVLPQWLMVVMHHSSLFADHRLHIATGVAYFGRSGGGALAYWPDGPDGDVALLATEHDTAIVLDTDSVFHGVDRVGGPDATPPALERGRALVARADGEGWDLVDADGRAVETLPEHDVRLSVSWKAYCFADDAERAAWERHDDDLDLDTILGRLLDDLRARGVADARPDDDGAFARLLIDTYIPFPVVAAG